MPCPLITDSRQRFSAPPGSAAKRPRTGIQHLLIARLTDSRSRTAPGGRRACHHDAVRPARQPSLAQRQSDAGFRTPPPRGRRGGRPYGGCSEPSNVAVGGHDCPLRFRCIGCGHFNTDISYLPDLERYLADLLRHREKLAASMDADEWACTEVMPSDEEIKRIRRPINRMKGDLEGPVRR
jgi:hypothetical protein